MAAPKQPPDAAKQQMNASIDQFKKQIIPMLDSAKSMMPELEKGVNGNLDQIGNSFRGGFKDLTGQIINGNAPIVTKYQESCQKIQQGLAEALNKMKSDSMNQFTSNITKLQGQMATAGEKYPVIKTLGEEAIKFLNSRKQIVLDQCDAQMKEVLKMLADATTDGVKKLRLTEADLIKKK